MPLRRTAISRSGKSAPDAGDELCREGDLRDKVDRAAVALKDFGDGSEVDLRLAAPRHTVEETGGETA